MKASNNSRSLNDWVNFVRDEEMPAFGHTIQSIIRVADDEETSARSLAQVILQDASMTTRVLRLANTIYYRTRQEKISTISRAVVLLGFDTVRNICLSISLVDALVNGNRLDRLTHELACAIHSAVQARSIAIERGDSSPEEIFIASLLYHIGAMAFWCFSEAEGEALHEKMRQPDYLPERAQTEVLGFQLSDLSNRLALEWHLSPLLREALSRPTAPNQRIRTINLAQKLANDTAIYGWHAKKTIGTIEEIAELTGGDLEAVSARVYQNAHEAARIACHFGAANAGQAIPLPMPGEQPQEDFFEEPAYPEADSMLQLKVLRELSQMLGTSGDFNMIMELVLEGIYRGVGMDRTLFALATPDRKELRGKFALGVDAGLLNKDFYFSKSAGHPNLFFHLLEQDEGVWFVHGNNDEFQQRVGPAISRVVGDQNFFVAPIIVRGKRIGVFYADRGPSGRVLDQDAFENFQLMVSQANMALTHIASGGLAG